MSLPEMSERRRAALTHALLFVLGLLARVRAARRQRHRAGPRAQLLPAVAPADRRRADHRVRAGLSRRGQAPASSARNGGCRWSGSRSAIWARPLVGMAFGAGWTPCIGPVLGAILGLAATTQDLTRGMLLLAAYSAGLAVPFLIAAVALDSFLDWFQRFRRYLPWVMRVSGVLLIFVGVLMVTGEFTRLAGWLQEFTPDRAARAHLTVPGSTRAARWLSFPASWRCPLLPAPPPAAAGAAAPSTARRGRSAPRGCPAPRSVPRRAPGSSPRRAPRRGGGTR